MINTPRMKFPLRAIVGLLLVLPLASCQTWNGFKNSFPVRFIDEIGASAMQMISENDASTQHPSAVLGRGQQVAQRGDYTGPAAAVVSSPRQRMAAR